MSNSGKTVPVFVLIIAAVAVAGLCLFALLSRGPSDPSSEDGTARGTSVGGKGVEVPATFTEDDAHQLKMGRKRVKELAANKRRVEIKLQGARHTALKSNPELQKRLNKAQEIKREVAAMIRALPARKELDSRHNDNLAQLSKIRLEIQATEKKVAQGRVEHEKAAEEGTESPVSESEMRAMLTNLKQLRKDSDILKNAARKYYVELKKLELQSREHHPEISAKAAEAERIRREVNQEISASDAVASVLKQQGDLRAESEALVKECSELLARSNRVALASDAGEEEPDG